MEWRAACIVLIQKQISWATGEWLCPDLKRWESRARAHKQGGQAGNLHFGHVGYKT